MADFRGEAMALLPGCVACNGRLEKIPGDQVYQGEFEKEATKPGVDMAPDGLKNKRRILGSGSNKLE